MPLLLKHRRFLPPRSAAVALCLALAAAIAPTHAQPVATQQAYVHRADAMQMAREIAAQHQLDANWVQTMIAQAEPVPAAVRLMRAPGPRSFGNWRAYRGRFVDGTRIHAGVEFWWRNQATLARAEAEFGVPAQIIVAIIGVETIYGRNTGDFSVRDALVTLALDFPAQHPRAAQRQAFFRDELGHFLLLCRQTGMNPADPLGSYAGAMGLPQFMPSSWRRWAVDYDGDGRIDLWHSEADAIGSVASYFRAHGWQPGMPTHYAAYPLPNADLNTLLGPDIEPTFTAAQMSDLGVFLRPDALTHDGPLALIKLENGNPQLAGNAPSYAAGTRNFYVVTRYNHSSYYAMAVIDLAQAIAAARRQEAELGPDSTQH